MSLRSALVLALVAVLSGQAAAQGQTAQWHSFAEKLPPASFVVVRMAGGSTIKGQLVQVMADSIVVLPRTRRPVPVRTLALADVQSIEVREEGMSPGAKVLSGAGIAGGVLLIVVWTMILSGHLGG
jgi:hypothetical protein